MRPRKPWTKTGNGVARGSSLEEHHGNLKNPKKPQKCFCHASDILLKGCELFYQNTGLFKLSLYSFPFLDGVLFCFPSLTPHIYRLGKSWAPNSAGNAGLCSERKKVMDSGPDLGKITPHPKMQNIPSHETLTTHLRISLIEEKIGHFLTLVGGSLFT